MADDLFNVDQDIPQDADPNVNYLEQLVGEGKKFQSNEDLAKGKYLSDNYVKILERRLDDMRSDYMKLDSDYKAGAKLQELISQLDNRQSPASSEQPNANEMNQQPTFDVNKIKEETRAEIQRYESERKQQENYNLLESKLKERYGDNYKAIFKSRIDEAGISEDLAKNLAVNHPQVLLKAIGADAEQPRDSYQPPIPSDRRGFAPSSPVKRTWSYYEKMRKEQPELYREPKIAVQMQEDYHTLGKEFEDGTFSH